MKHIIFASYGNDSIALIQWAREKGLDDVHVAYSDTGWAAPFWAERVDRCEAWVRSLGFTHHRIESEGMRSLVERKKGWPRQGYQYCTTHLKLEPAKAWLAEHDPEGEAVCLVGIRRAESRARRAFPEWTEDSDNHGGRTLWAPLVRFSDEDRDKLLRRAGFEPLPHRSQECYPCVNANRGDIRLLTEARIADIEAFETALGFTSKGKPRTMFRPYRHQGASGIREVAKWANSERGQYQPLVVLGQGGCDSGMCEAGGGEGGENE